MPIEEIRAVQLNLLLSIIRHAYEHTSLYREKFDAIGLKPSDIRQFTDAIFLYIQFPPIIDSSTGIVDLYYS